MTLMQQTWSELLFIHIEVDAQELAKLIPEKLELDLFQGKAYVSLVPFKMEDIRPIFCPSLPYFSSMNEFNLRTYVKFKDQSAVYFFSLDADKTLHIEFARKIFKLNYLKAKINYSSENRTKSFNCIRKDSRDHQTEASIKFSVDQEILDLNSDSLDFWLTYRFSYLEQKKNKVFQGNLTHPQWQLQRATLIKLKENLLEKYRIKAVSDQYLCHYAKSMKVEIKSFKMIDDE